MGKFIDLEGQKFGRWTVGEYLGNSKWLCRCECGVEKQVYSIGLRIGTSKSCGCLSSELVSKRNSERNQTHGLSKDPIYEVYSNMIGRCSKKEGAYYRDYTLRGIVVCSEWSRINQGALHFIEWAKANGYRKGLQLDREDNDGNYEPSNCRFVTPRENSMNTRMSANNKSGYEGIGFHKASEKWRSRVVIFGKERYLGLHGTKKQALEARNNYIIKNNLTEYKIQEWNG
jgi:hypothetical protein